MKKIILAAAISAAIVAPVASQAEGMISTDLADYSSGVTSLYYQHKLSDTGAIKAGVLSAIGVSIFDVAYKGALGGEIFNGAYFQVGAYAGGAASIPYIGLGYDFGVSDNIVLGGFYNVTTVGVSGYGIDVGFKF